MNKILITTLCVVMVVTAGCGSRGKKGESDTSQESPATEAAAAVPTFTPTSAPDPVQEAPATAANQVPAAAVQTVENANTVNSYRMHVTTRSESARGVDSVEIEGTFVKEPPAERIVMNFLEGDQAQSMEMVAVDGVRYMKSGDMWVQTPDVVFHTDELTMITPQDVTDLADRMTHVGVEMVNARTTDHYRGDRDMIPVVGTEGDTLDVSEIEFAQLDLWIDQAEGIVIKLLLEASDSSGETPTSMSVMTEYSDFNADFVIEAPDLGDGDAGEDAGAAPVADAPRTDLGRVLGFDLLLPTGSTIQLAAGDALLVAATPYTFEEAEKWIELNLPANGYAQVTKIGPADGQIIFMFQNQAKMVTVTISQAEDGTAVVQFAAAP